MASKPIYIYLAPFFPSHDSWRGGFFFDAVKALIGEGSYDVRVIVGQAGDDYEIDGIKVARFEPLKIGASDYFNFLTDAIKCHRFGKKLKKLGIDIKNVAVCHIHLLERYAIYGVWIKRKNPLCFVVAHHHWTGASPLGAGRLACVPFVKEIQYLRLRHSYELMDSHVFCSVAAKEGYGRVYSDGFLGNNHDMRDDLMLSQVWRPMKCPMPKVVYNGIDTKVFNSDDRKEALDVFRIGCVANFIGTKSQITLLEAYSKVCCKMPHSQLVFVGSGEELGLCMKYATENGIEGFVEFTKEMPHTEMPSFYKSLSLFVLPSYHEAFNCSLIEAWACGVPCIATREISFKEVLSPTDQQKWLFPAKDVNALADLLLCAYRERPARQLLARDLDINTITKDFLKWVYFASARLSIMRMGGKSSEYI